MDRESGGKTRPITILMLAAVAVLLCLLPYAAIAGFLLTLLLALIVFRSWSGSGNRGLHLAVGLAMVTTLIFLIFQVA
jgi:hypothetical protein